MDRRAGGRLGGGNAASVGPLTKGTAPARLTPRRLRSPIQELKIIVNQPADALTQDGLAETVGQLAQAIAFMDCCDKCGVNADAMTPPYAADVGDGWLHGRYRCVHGHEWTCDYSLDFPAWF
jgi:hypothetical protein